MKECTQRELWAKRPGSDASEEEVARYLDHVGQCEFHAEIEQREERSIRDVAAFAFGGGAEKKWVRALKVAAVIAAVAAMVLLSLFFLRSRPRFERVEVPRESPTGSPSPVNEVITNNNPSPAPTVSPNINAGRPVQTSVKNVKRIYVASGGGDYNELLRAALITELKQSGRFVVVTHASDADAVMETDSTRGANVRVQLVNRVGKALWFTTQSTTDQGGESAKEVAARVIRALSEEAK